MATPSRGSLITQLRLMLATWKEDPRSDVELLNRFIDKRDEGAFTILVARHGKAVWDICRTILGNVVDAEDAFQGTFILLSQRATQIVRQKALVAWLSGVARRVAWTARRSMLRRRRLLDNAKAAVTPPDTEPPPQIMQVEIAAVLREEVEGLPEALRVPLVHRYLEDKTLSEIAFVLGCSDRTVAKRLERGENVLRRRLVTRGMSAGSASLAALLGAGSLEAALPSRVVESTIQAAMSAAPVSNGLFASASALIGRLLASRVGLGIVVLLGLLAVGGVYGLTRLLAPPPNQVSESDQVQRVAQDPGQRQPNPPAIGEAEGPPLPQVAQDLGQGTVAVGGRVMDDSGKAIANARVAVLNTRLSQRGQRAFRENCLGEADSNDEGRFRLHVPEHFASDLRGLAIVKVLIHAPGYGLGTLRRSLYDGPLPPVVLDMEKPLSGRLLDPRGRPAVGVRVSVVMVGYVICQDLSNPAAGPLPPHWPKPAITDEDGRYEIAGLGRKEHIQLVIDDERYGVDNIYIDPGQEAPAEMTLRSPRVLQGRVLGADTHKALAGVRITALRGFEDFKDLSYASSVTDAEGHFRMPLKPGLTYYLEFFPPEGVPYLAVIKPCPGGLREDEEAEFTLPRGTYLAGRVTDASTAKPIANVLVQYVPGRHNDPGWREDMATCSDGAIATDSEGRFSLAVSRAGGHLLLHAQEDVYRVVATDMGEIRHAHAIIPLDPSGDVARPELKIELHAGVSVKGSVIRPDGQPVSGGFLVSRRRVWSKPEELRPVILTDQGRFTFEGCEPGRAERVLILDATEKWGAVTDVAPPAPGAEPLTVRVERCGQARVTLVDEEGLPLPNVGVKLMVCLPEPNALLGKSFPDDRRNSRILGIHPAVKELVTDRRGQVLLPGLVPNARYQLVDRTEKLLFGSEIQVVPEQQLDVKIVVRRP